MILITVYLKVIMKIIKYFSWNKIVKNNNL